MSVDCWIHQISPHVLEKLKSYPSLVDLFLEAHRLPESPDDYWQAIEELKDDWEQEEECFLGTVFERITPEVFEQVKLDIPLVRAEGRNEPFWLGGKGALGWFYAKFQGIEIGNERYYEKVRYLTADKVREETEALSDLIAKNAREIWNTLYPEASDVRDSGEDDFIDFFYELLNYLGNTVERKNALLLYMT